MRPGFLARPLFALLAVMLLAWLAYRPGLTGGFVFDDYANLPALGATGPVDNAATFWRYITSGQADPTGRPLALLSFLLDGHDWPTSAHPFKQTNLILHLLTGALLALLLRQLGRELYGRLEATQQSRIDLAAVLGAAFWLLHPLLVSTTLYVVQREAMLPAFFTVVGLLLYLAGRRQCRQGNGTKGLACLLAGLGACTLLAVLSKANGILLPALALTMEAVLPGFATTSGDARVRRLYRTAMVVLAVVPAIVVAAYLVYEGWHGFAYGISSVRPWSLGQRLLTEPRVLIDYLALLWLPHPFTPGLFNDHIVASTSLGAPATTLPALLAVAGLLAGAILLRRRLPAAALAVLFYFVGQSVESSTIALELYFEHRNYLPALLMFWPLALWLCGVPQMAGAAKRAQDAPGRRLLLNETSLKAGLAVILILGLAVMTHARSALWGNSHDQALLWARLNPASPRAQAYAAHAEMSTGHPERAAKRLQAALAKTPNEVQLALNLLAARCQMGQLDPDTWQAAVHALGSDRDSGSLLEHWFERAIEQSAHPQCPQMGLDGIETLLSAAQGNPHLADRVGRRQDLYHLQGRIALLRGQPDLALQRFDKALDLQVRAPAAFRQAALLGSAGYPRQGLAHLAHYEAEHDRENRPAFGMPRVHAWVLTHQQYWQHEYARLRATLRQDAATQAPAIP